MMNSGPHNKFFCIDPTTYKKQADLAENYFFTLYGLLKICFTLYIKRKRRNFYALRKNSEGAAAAPREN